jgi:hypothetical protein
MTVVLKIYKKRLHKSLIFSNLKENYMQDIEWRDVEGYHGLYQVSNHGSVRRRGKIIATSMANSGYLFVSLYKNDVRKNMYVHRIVAMAFIDNKESFKYINHKDNSKLNNNADNLEWCTQAHNLWHSANHGRRALDRKKVVAKTIDNIVIGIYNSIKDAARELGLNSGVISACCHGKQKTIYKKYKFEFAA